MQFSSVTLFALSMLCTGIAADYKLPDGFNTASVKPGDVISWCIAQQNSCPLICNGNVETNTCDTTDFTFECECSDGKTPDVSQYKDTFPFFVCQENFAQCISNNAADSDSQQKCKDARKKCGTKDPKDAESSATTTSSASGMSTATQDSASATGSGSGTGAAEPTETGAAVAQKPAGVFAAAMIAALGLFL